MKFCLSAIPILLLIASASQGQYYYKDIVTTRNTAEQLKKYKEQNIRSVILNSFESDGSATEGFKGSQTLSNNFTKLVTTIESPIHGSSELVTTFNPAGYPTRTIDTTDGAGSISEYSYDDKGRLISIENISSSPGLHSENEKHLWFYDASGKPEKMYRIKNNADTSYITFIVDEKGNVTEENTKRNGSSLPSIYYYYDNQNRLTDIVNYNSKAHRLLPAFVFEYTDAGLMNSMLVVPEGSSDYQLWRYTYNDAGLKTRETCMNKRKQVVGRIEYVYR